MNEILECKEQLERLTVKNAELQNEIDSTKLKILNRLEPYLGRITEAYFPSVIKKPSISGKILNFIKSVKNKFLQLKPKKMSSAKRYKEEYFQSIIKNQEPKSTYDTYIIDRIRSEIMFRIGPLFGHFKDDTEYLMSSDLINQKFFNCMLSRNQIEYVVLDVMGFDYYKDSSGRPTNIKYEFVSLDEEFKRQNEACIGRPFIFKRELFELNVLFPNIHSFLRHIFGNQYQMGLDYIQLLLKSGTTPSYVILNK